MEDEVLKKQHCCRCFAKKLVMFMNGLIFFLGAIVLGISVINAVVQGDVLEAVGEAGVVGSIIASVVLMFTAMLGCLAVTMKKKVLFVCYFLMALALSLAFLTIGSLMTFTVKDLNNIDGVNSNTLTDVVESRLNDFLIATFNECCEAQFDGIERLLGCSEEGANLAACFTFEETYEDALNRVRTTQFCAILENTEVEGVFLVGDPDDGGCAEGNGVLFKQSLTDYVEEALIPIGSTFIVFGVLLLLTLLATCVIICANKKTVLESEHSIESLFNIPQAPPKPEDPPPKNELHANFSSAEKRRAIYRPRYEWNPDTM